MAISVTAFDIAQRFIGVTEVSGVTSNPQVLAMLRLVDPSVANDDVPWCSAFANYVTWLLRLPRSKSLMARSWLGVGQSVSIQEAQVGFDVVVLKRGEGVQPGPEVLDAPGHVGFFAGWQDGNIMLLSGNHLNSVNVSPYPVERILGVRRLMS